MAYTPGTILKRVAPFLPPEDETEPDLTVYNEVVVIGQSQVVTPVPEDEAVWGGTQAEDWTIAPTSFGAPVDRKAGQLEEDYEVVSIPNPAEDDLGVVVTKAPNLLSPEEAFRIADREAAKKPARKAAADVT